MTTVAKARCGECGSTFDLASPAHIICQKCGSGKLEFENEMVFKCEQGHEQRGLKADERCKECFDFQLTSLRHFIHLKKQPEPLQPPQPDDKDEKKDKKEEEYTSKAKKPSKAVKPRTIKSRKKK